MIGWLRQHRDALGQAMRRLAATPVNTVLSVLAIGVALALPAAGQMLFANLQTASRGVAARPQISAFMTMDAERRATQEVQARLARMNGVAHVQLVSREDTLARMKAGPGLAEVLDALPQNPFPDALIVTPQDERPEKLQSLAAEMRKLPRVEHVQLDSAWVARLDAFLRLGRTAVILLGLLFGIGLTAITFNTIRLQVLANRAEIDISRLLGATEAFVRRPYYWFGLLLGLSGGAAAWGIVAATGAWLRGPIGDLAALYRINFALTSLPAGDVGLLLAFAAALGWIGAALSLYGGRDGGG